MKINHNEYIGKKIGRWLFLHKAPETFGKNKYVWAKCDCGNEKLIRLPHVLSGISLSCGCLQKEQLIARSLKHGEAKHDGSETTEFKTWKGIQERCYGITSPHYKRYGGRGIKMCERWRLSYLSFLENMGRRPSALHSIDRINNDGDYEPENCRWATRKEQSYNRGNTIYISLFGEKKSIWEWSKITNLSLQTLRARYRNNWKPLDILNTPHLSNGGIHPLTANKLNKTALVNHSFGYIT